MRGEFIIIGFFAIPIAIIFVIAIIVYIRRCVQWFASRRSNTRRTINQSRSSVTVVAAAPARSGAHTLRGQVISTNRFSSQHDEYLVNNYGHFTSTSRHTITFPPIIITGSTRNQIFSNNWRDRSTYVMNPGSQPTSRQIISTISSWPLPPTLDPVGVVAPPPYNQLSLTGVDDRWNPALYSTYSVNADSPPSYEQAISNPSPEITTIYRVNTGLTMDDSMT